MPSSFLSHTYKYSSGIDLCHIASSYIKNMGESWYVIILCCLYYGEQKTNKEKSHKGIWWWECPWSVLGINSGRPRDTRDVWADSCGNSHKSGQNVRGTDGTDDGTDGTCPRDRRDTNQGVSRQNSLCLLVFFRSPYIHMAAGTSAAHILLKNATFSPVLKQKWLKKNCPYMDKFFAFFWILSKCTFNQFLEDIRM